MFDFLNYVGKSGASLPVASPAFIPRKASLQSKKKEFYFHTVKTPSDLLVNKGGMVIMANEDEVLEYLAGSLEFILYNVAIINKK